MEFIIQRNLMDEEQLNLIRDAVKDIPHRFIEVIPFSHVIACETPLIGKDFIPIGSTLLTNLSYGWEWTGVHFDISRFNYEASISGRRDMLNDEYILSVRGAISFMQGQRRGSDWFIRPSKDLKQFSGQVIEAWECAEWLQDALECASSGTYHLDENETVVIAAPKNILAEWRWFIIGGKVISGAMYRENGRLIKKRELDDDVICEAQVLAYRWLPDQCCVMDTALVETSCGDQQLKVLEFNCINSSGFYGHDVEAIFKTLYKYHEARM